MATETFVRFDWKIKPSNWFEVVNLTKIRQKSEGSHPKNLAYGRHGLSRRVRIVEPKSTIFDMCFFWHFWALLVPSGRLRAIARPTWSSVGRSRWSVYEQAAHPVIHPYAHSQAPYKILLPNMGQKFLVAMLIFSFFCGFTFLPFIYCHQDFCWLNVSWHEIFFVYNNAQEIKA